MILHLAVEEDHLKLTTAESLQDAHQLKPAGHCVCLEGFDEIHAGVVILIEGSELGF